MPTQVGYGVGLRVSHYPVLLREGLSAPVAEAITENFMGRGGRPRALLERLRADTELLLHGVSLSIGGLDPFPTEYLAGLRELVQIVEPHVVSDHLCFGTHGGHYGHDLWPLPYTEEALDHVVARVTHVQEFLGRPIALENVSSYVTYSSSQMPEWEFVAQVVERSGCQLLLDINNVYVSSVNHSFDPLEYLAGVAAGSVVQYHLAGHKQCDGYLLDNHGSPVAEPVWRLFEAAIERFGEVTTIVEWDDHVPPLAEVLAQATQAAERARTFKAELKSRSAWGLVG